MSRSTRIIALAAVAVFAACSDRTSPDPLADEPLPARAASSEREVAEPARERLARRLARALADPGFRAVLKRELDRSPVAERKLHLQRLLSANGRVPRAVARLNGESEAAVHADAREAIPLELYFPVPEHRSAWRGDARLLVATAADDHEAPVAFAPSGRRRILDPDAPPDIPVLALVPVETDFDRLALPQPTPPPPPGGTPKTPAGLHMTKAHFSDDFEGWLKGKPELEVHVLGQAGSSDSLISYACAGEHAGGYYAFDQNGTDWTGDVLLFSQAQIDSYKRQHPNQNLRLFVVEDDDAACQIKADSKRFATLVTAVEAAYPLLTGGRDSTAGLQKYWKRANALQKILKALGSLITTSDDLVGNAVESSVTGTSYPGANWVVKGDRNTTNGWLNLVVR